MSEMAWWDDDDRLFAALKDAVAEAREVPPEFVQAGKAIFTWRDVDAELAALTYDSAAGDDLASALRGAEAAPLRALIFATADLTVELEVEAESLVGQLDPPLPGTAELLLAGGEGVTTPIDEDGCFVFRPPPAGDFRLCCRPAPAAPGHGAAGVMTGWIRL
ncbi:hypothetical protein [Actinomadura rubrisoli]|uniref:Uncharacterized protein n=1 Tax=Actinomadura rubrisoli TaxID=2530368 RepID=A0A4V2YUY9_9ACTN|nr:hypothetical protein [Actinomadura rubrisoli]TDD79527.1 hypothetical protein E1298_27565 [Actinomadura rubrisoli]